MRGDRSKPARRDAHTSPGACNEPPPHFPTSLANLNAVIFKCKGLCGAGRGIFLLSSCVNATASRPSDGGSDSPGGPGWLDVAAPGSAGGEGGGGAAGWSRRGSSRFPPLSRRFWRVKKIRESQFVCKEPVNTLGANLGEGRLLLVRLSLQSRAGGLLWDETYGGRCCKKAIFGGLSGYRVVLSSTLAACWSKICLCRKTSGRLCCQGGRERVCR